jgi:lipopolysaccharide transport system permease protein
VTPVNTKWLSELWRYRELVYFLAWRDVKVRYKQAALGVAWAILQPLLTMVAFTLIFGKLAGVPSDGIPYPLFSFCGLVLWSYFSGVLAQAGQSLLANSNLITKVYFPRIALPLSTAVAGLIDFGVGLVFLVVLMGYYGVQPAWSLLWAPFFLGALVVLTVGTGMLLSALTVRYRDIKHTIPFLIQLGLFVTPVIYPMSIVPEPFKTLMALNPLAGIVEGFRACVVSGRPIDPMLTAVSLTVTALIFLLGLVCFRTTERAFADII